jgi:hypothetical protein
MNWETIESRLPFSVDGIPVPLMYGGGGRIYVQEEEPPDLQDGDIWVNPSLVAPPHEHAFAMGFVNHGSDPNVLRPLGYASVTWKGSVAPANATEDDLWIDTS